MRLTTTWLSATGVKIPDLWPLNIVLNLSASGTQLAKAEELLSLLASAFSAVPQAESTLPAATNESFQLLFVQMPALGAMFYKTKKKNKAKKCFANEDHPSQVLTGRELTFSGGDLVSSIHSSSAPWTCWEATEGHFPMSRNAQEPSQQTAIQFDFSGGK